MTEHDWVAVLMIKIKASALSFYGTMRDPAGGAHCDGENWKDECIEFVNLHINKIVSVINLILKHHKTVDILLYR